MRFKSRGTFAGVLSYALTLRGLGLCQGLTLPRSGVPIFGRFGPYGPPLTVLEPCHSNDAFARTLSRASVPREVVRQLASITEGVSRYVEQRDRTRWHLRAEHVAVLPTAKWVSTIALTFYSTGQALF